MRDELTARLQRFVQREGVPAVGAALLSGTSGITVAAVGQRVRSRPEPVTTDDCWHIGSCGKAMTATLVALLVERDLTRWQATIPELFGDLGHGLHPTWSEVTLTQLLAHESGLPANPKLAEMLAASQDRAPITEQRTRTTIGALSRPAHRTGRFRYSNLGYIVVGAAIERMTGRSYEEALTGELLQPLGISGAGFGAPSGAQPWGHRPRWRHRYGRGPAIDPTQTTGHDMSDNPPFMSPAGRMHLPLSEWAKFVRLFFDQPDRPLLQPSSMATLTAVSPGSGPRRMAMGWVVPADGRIALGAQGSNVRWVATVMVGPDRRTAVLVACNDGRRKLLARSGRFASNLLATI